MTKRMSRREMRAAGLLRHPSDHENVDGVENLDGEVEKVDESLEHDTHGAPDDDHVAEAPAEETEPAGGDEPGDAHVDPVASDDVVSEDIAGDDDVIDEGEPVVGDDIAETVAASDEPVVEAGDTPDEPVVETADEDVEHEPVDDDVQPAGDATDVEATHVEGSVESDIFAEPSAETEHAVDSPDESELESTRAMMASDIDEVEKTESEEDIDSTPPARTSVFDRFSSTEPVVDEAEEEADDEYEDPDYRNDLRAKLAADREESTPNEAVTETVDVYDEDEEEVGSSWKTILFFALLIIVGFGLGILIGFGIFGSRDSADALLLTTTLDPGLL